MSHHPNERREFTFGSGPVEQYDLAEGYRLGWNVGEDGDMWPMIADLDLVGIPQVVACRPEHFRILHIAPHEQLGPLPELYHARLHVEEDA